MKRLLALVEGLNKAFWDRVRLSTEVSQESLWLLRPFVGIYLLMIYSPFFAWIGEVPSVFFYPPLLSLPNLLSGFPPAWFFLWLDILVSISIVLMTLGIRAKLATRALVLLLFVGYNFQFSMGKIDHNIFLLIFLGCLSFAGWGSGFALIPDKPVAKLNVQKCMALLAVLFCFGMFTAGSVKGINWIDFDITKNGFLRWYYSSIYVKQSGMFLSGSLNALPYAWLDVFDWGGVFFELSAFLLLLAGRKFWKLWLLGACTFHLLNLLILNIAFSANFIFYVAFIDFGRYYDWAKIQFSKSHILWISSTSLLAFLYFRFAYIFDSSFFNYHKLLKADKLSLYIILVVWSAGVVLFAYSTWNEFMLGKKNHSHP
ncbi:hypothetical protein [Algoriphagus yeomjeoni]|uniref:Vitamin K-dependent gamma-carboxylase-like protein n=1 Tax=Algoriphagus yeomjeoni TaxID=291403 RepID=A0A327PI77_9BACT|nr:hypothetical protein [Algoriphagus yeomjeoni]RAI91979.1 hypothetical protein LV83_01205 [Algoriphagus yeomjeoni]